MPKVKHMPQVKKHATRLKPCIQTSLYLVMQVTEEGAETCINVTKTVIMITTIMRKTITTTIQQQ